MPLITHTTRLRAQPFMLAYEVIDILKLGAAARVPAELGWVILPNTFEVTGFVQNVPPMPEHAIREVWMTWADIVGARYRTETEVDGRVHLRASTNAFGDHLVRVTIEAVLPAP